MAGGKISTRSGSREEIPGKNKFKCEVVNARGRMLFIFFFPDAYPE